jgi:hypothetical protein
MAVAATALGVFNRVQIEELKLELFEVKENTGQLFEVVQDFSQSMIALETGFNKIRTTLLYQVTFSPMLFDSHLSRPENQLRSCLHRFTHAIQAAMHQHSPMTTSTLRSWSHCSSSYQRRQRKPDVTF